MATTALTDSQRVILATAGARDTGLVLPLAKSLGSNRGTTGIILKSLLSRGLIAERLVRPGEEHWRERGSGERLTLVVTDNGLKMIGIEPQELHPEEEHAANIGAADDDREVVGARNPGSDASAAKGDVATLPKVGTKLATLLTALRRPAGATIADLIEATGWQAHSVRGAISGSLKKKLQLEVTSNMVEGRGRVYRIAEAASE